MSKKDVARRIGLLTVPILTAAALYTTRLEPVQPEVIFRENGYEVETNSAENRPEIELLSKRAPTPEELILSIIHSGQNEPNQDKYDYSHPRIQHFYNLFRGERSRDIQTRIERTREYDNLIREAANDHNIPYATLFALIVNESGGNPQAVSTAGARGLTQIMPRTASSRGCRDLADPETSINCGAQILAEYAERFGSLDLGLAAYAIGPSMVREKVEAAGTNNYRELFPEGEYVPGIRAIERVFLDQ